MYSCKNYDEDYKKYFFPLKDNAKRAKPEVSFCIDEEDPFLVNPYEERDTKKHFEFDGPVEL